jgi:ornithine decarboxylase
VEVIGVKPRLPPATSGTRATLDESVYGIFSNIPFDGFRPVFEHLAPDARHRPQEATTLFGRTCDSADCILEDVQLPALRVGDRMRVRNMGAYTVVSSSEFNGFPAPLRQYVELA